jgi:drug/metabolite transporter (DMT)-like permease
VRRESRTLAATLFALLAFSANSLLCRLALRDTSIDPASFTSIRLVTGAITLQLLVRLRTGHFSVGGDWRSAAALLLYAATFSFAYVRVTAGTGALLLFGAVQLVMIFAGFLARERVDAPIVVGWLLAMAGVTTLLIPGASAAPVREGGLMLCAGIAWGIYTLQGRRSTDPLLETAGNFARAVPAALLISAVCWSHRVWDPAGAVYAALSGSIASGLGYAAWYTALPRLGALTAGNVQLGVPVLAALGGVALFGEPVTPRLVASSILVLGGIAIAIRWSNKGMR